MQDRAAFVSPGELRSPPPATRQLFIQSRTAILFSWGPLAVILLTSAIFTQMLIELYDMDRPVLLGTQYSLWAVVAYLLFKAVSRVTHQKSTSKISQSIIALLLSIGLAMLGVWLTGRRSDIFDLTLQTGALVFLALPFFVMERVARVFRVDQAVMTICHTILFLGLCSIGSDYFGVTKYEVFGERYFGFLGDQIAWALTISTLVYFSTNRPVLAVIAASLLALTASRGPALVIVAGLVLLMLFNRGRRLRYGAMASLMLVFAVYNTHLFEALISRFSSTEFFANDRLATARLGLKLFMQSPLYGSGYNALTHFYPSTMLLVERGILHSQTSTFVQMLSDGGLFTFLAYVSFVITVTFVGIRLLRRAKQIVDGTVISGLVAWLLAMLWINQSALWFVVGSYVGPLVLGIAGIVAGTWVRFSSREQATPLKLSRYMAASRKLSAPLR